MRNSKGRLNETMNLPGNLLPGYRDLNEERAASHRERNEKLIFSLMADRSGCGVLTDSVKDEALTTQAKFSMAYTCIE